MGRQTEQRAPLYVFGAAAPCLEVVEVTPELIVVAPYVFAADRNPHNLDVYHAPGMDAPGHDCGPRAMARCIACGRTFNHCMSWTPETEATCQSELDAILERRWVCAECGGAS
jgi:hypothetical protein